MRIHQIIACALITAFGCGRGLTEINVGNDAGQSANDSGVSSDAGSDAGAADAGSDAGSTGSGDAGSVDAGVPEDAGTPADAGSGGTAATVRIHYPAGSHTISIRGGAAPLSWTAGQAMTAGASDTWNYSIPTLAAAIEFKPLLDDSVWAHGPNYHLAPGRTLDIYPHFNASSGQVKTLIASFHSTVLNNNRAIYAYLPASYAENTAATYPVVYMHDGQNLWAALPNLAFSATWNVDTAFDNASEKGACSASGIAGWGAQPLGGNASTCTGDGDCASGECRTFAEAIVIAPANTAGRIYEYTPTTDPSYPSGGGGDLYIQMLVTELKPQIESMLRVRTGPANTALVGSSLGGLISSYAGAKRPDVYGLIGAISPSTWWNNDVLVGDISGTQAATTRPLRVYVDSGQGDTDDESDTDMLSAAYLGLGYQDGINYRHVIQPGASHNEVYWAERFPGAMQLLLGER